LRGILLWEGGREKGMGGKRKERGREREERKYRVPLPTFVAA